MLKLSNEDLQLLSALDSRTGARAVDVLNGEASIVFLLEKGELGKAIGKGGANLERLRGVFGKNVEFVEYSPELGEFVKNLFKPVEVLGVDKDGSEVAVKVENAKRGLAIGRGGEKIKRAKALLKKYFGVSDVKLL